MNFEVLVFEAKMYLKWPLNQGRIYFESRPLGPTTLLFKYCNKNNTNKSQLKLPKEYIDIGVANLLMTRRKKRADPVQKSVGYLKEPSRRKNCENLRVISLHSMHF